MDDPEKMEKQMRRRSRTVSWDHSVRSDGDDGFRTNLGIQLSTMQVFMYLRTQRRNQEIFSGGVTIY